MIAGDYQSLYQQLSVEMDKQGTAAAVYLNLAIATAIKRYRSHPLPWNLLEDEFETTADEGDYGERTEDPDVEGFHKDTIAIRWAQYNEVSTPGIGWEIEPKSLHELKEHRLHRLTSGPPRYYHFKNRGLRLAPVPDRAYTISLSSVIDLYGIAALWDGSEWVLRANAGQAVTGSYTSPWFTEGSELLRAAAKRYLWAEVLYDDDSARAAESAELIALHRIMNEDRQPSGGMTPFE